MEFHEWWVAEVGAAPEGDEGNRILRLCLRVWKAALAYGDRRVEPQALEDALTRVGQGESNTEDERLIRLWVRIANETIAFERERIESLESGLRAQAAKIQSNRTFMPDGATPLPGNRWRCPRCNFIGGLKRVEHTCRGCGYPGEDTRSWIEEEKSRDDEDSAS
jgi:hypothetical protein